jgi:predicted transcriptional regulator
MATPDLDLTKPVPMTDEEDEETLAAIDRGIQSADEGRLVPIEEVRERLAWWSTKSSTLKPR